MKLDGMDFSLLQRKYVGRLNSLKPMNREMASSSNILPPTPPNFFPAVC